MATVKFEPLGDGIEICVSKEHTFGTDAFLLADFAAPKSRDKICDLGTGCGIIPVLLKMKHNPALIVGVDIQEQAIEQFKATVERNHFEGVIPITADIKSLWEGYPRGLDLVTCNPPYKAAGAGLESVSEAQKIARHELLCNLNDVCAAAVRLLRFGGRLCLCNRPERLADVITAMKNNNIEPKLLRFVSKTPAASPWLFLIEGRLGSKPFMRVLPNIFLNSINY